MGCVFEHELQLGIVLLLRIGCLLDPAQVSREVGRLGLEPLDHVKVHQTLLVCVLEPDLHLGDGGLKALELGGVRHILRCNLALVLDPVQVIPQLFDFVLFELVACAKRRVAWFPAGA
jgi:hypothetical protein